MSLYFNIDPSQFNSTSELLSFLNRNRVCLYSTLGKDFCSLPPEKEAQRVSLDNKRLKISIKKGDVSPFGTKGFNAKLHPRTELVLGPKWTQPRYTLKVNTDYTFIYQFYLDKYTVGAEIFQIMGQPNFEEMKKTREYGRTKPLLQLEQKRNGFTARGWGVGVDVKGKPTCTNRSPGKVVSVLKTDTTGKIFTAVIQYRASKDNGVLKVWITPEGQGPSSKPQFEHGCSSNYHSSSNISIQFGLYMKDSSDNIPRRVLYDQNLYVHNFQIYKGFISPSQVSVIPSKPPTVLPREPSEPSKPVIKPEEPKPSSFKEGHLELVKSPNTFVKVLKDRIELPKGHTIIFKTSEPDMVGRVEFVRQDGRIIRTERKAPFALNGDSGMNDIHPYDGMLNGLVVRVYDHKNQLVQKITLDSIRLVCSKRRRNIDGEAEYTYVEDGKTQSFYCVAQTTENFKMFHQRASYGFRRLMILALTILIAWSIADRYR